MNTRFHYLYRDGSNYKSWGELVFLGEASEDSVARLRAALDGGEFFIADQVQVPERFFDGWPKYADDHCFHEFDSLEPTEELPDDACGRSMADFVAEVEKASDAGWHVFDPQDRTLNKNR